jgi:hypothetical protein
MSGWHEAPDLRAKDVLSAVASLINGAPSRLYERLRPCSRRSGRSSCRFAGMLPPLGIVFAQVVGFLAAGVWSVASDAPLAVGREASALR